MAARDPAPISIAHLDAVRPARAPVTHAYAALAYYTGGSARVEQRGQWTLRAGDVLLVPPGEPHRFVEADRPTLWGLGLCAPCFAADGLLEPFDRVRAGAGSVVHIAPDRRPFLESLLVELAAAPHAEPVQRSLLTLILHEVARAAGWRGAPPRPRGLVAESLAFIERHCLGPLSLRDVASAVGRTPAHVTTALSRATGRSAVAWIVAHRMAEARRLLLSDLPVDAIAARVGYADATHFIRMFRRAHGVTPAAWRTSRT